MDIEIKNRAELDSRILAKISNHECIHEEELLDRITDIMLENHILTEEIQCCRDRLDVKKTAVDSSANDDVNRLDCESHKAADFDCTWVALDFSDNHVLENKTFDRKEDAEELAKEYLEQCVSLVENSYGVMKVSRDCLQYGAFPYEKQLYFIYDIEQ